MQLASWVLRGWHSTLLRLRSIRMLLIRMIWVRRREGHTTILLSSCVLHGWDSTLLTLRSISMLLIRMVQVSRWEGRTTILLSSWVLHAWESTLLRVRTERTLLIKMMWVSRLERHSELMIYLRRHWRRAVQVLLKLSSWVVGGRPWRGHVVERQAFLHWQPFLLYGRILCLYVKTGPVLVSIEEPNMVIHRFGQLLLGQLICCSPSFIDSNCKW